MRQRRAGLLGILVSGALVVPSVCGAQPAPPANDVCLTCHAEPSMVRADGRPVVVHAESFAASIHGSLGCIDCHVDLARVADFPHPERLAPVTCATCHDEPAAGLGRSAHGPTGGAGGPLQCASCHGPPHQIAPSSAFESPTSKLQVARTCGQCHGGVVAAGGRPGPAVAGLFADSIHAIALTRTTVAPTCTDCHRSHDILRKTDPASPAHARNIPATCGTCHADQRRLYGGSVHAAALGAGHPLAPQCVSCHTAHRMAPTAGSQWQLAAVEQCGTCHREALATYRDSFHGQVTALGFTPVAKCVDCHASHEIFPVADARSTVAPANRLATCQTCHPSATQNFLAFQPHANKNDRERLPALYYAARFMNTLLAGVFAFFGAHTLLWFVRERAESTGEGDPRG
ncbi:MAG: hypothetical protein HY824_04335 [Acidobacteria bacterium]|nr:hypothetical protein [Acidobacteriota bacterium]